MTQPYNELTALMARMQREIADEYGMIQRRVKEDPGTAGDQAEETWAELLRGWLPAAYHVVTKGRVVGLDGAASGQMDVVVLKPSYPVRLRRHKMYLAAGVAAAFECKLTLKVGHIEKAFQNCVRVKRLFKPRAGSPYLELHAPVIYGLLAHSFSGRRDIRKSIDDQLKRHDQKVVAHPREVLDVLCVADQGCWTSTIPVANWPPGQIKITTLYHRPDEIWGPLKQWATGSLIRALTIKLACEDPELRDLAAFYKGSMMTGAGGGPERDWPAADVFTPDTASAAAERRSTGGSWDQWRCFFP